MAERRPGDPRLCSHLGVNYDVCHFAIQFEEANASLTAFRWTKYPHQQNPSELRAAALQLTTRVWPLCARLPKIFTFIKSSHGETTARFCAIAICRMPWKRTSRPTNGGFIFTSRFTRRRLPDSTPPLIKRSVCSTGWRRDPDACHHLEMETYTWAVLPPDLKSASVTDQLVREYEWILPQLVARALL